MFFKKKSKAESVGQMSRPESLLSADEFTFQNLRHWSDLEEHHVQLMHYGFVEIVDTIPQSLRESDKRVSVSEFDMLKRYSLAVGICRKAHFQYKVFEYNCVSILERFEFDDSGMVSFQGGALADLYVEVNAEWQNAIVSGQKFLTWLEGDLEERFGRGSGEVKRWRDALAEAADVSLVADLCYRNPAVVERDFLFLNMANVDYSACRTGFVIGIDRGFMDNDLGETLRTKIARITKDRKARGLSPQLSVNELVGSFRAQVALLYAKYLSIMMKDADKTSDLVEDLFENQNLNCVVVKMSNPAPGLPSRLVFRMPAASLVEYYTSIRDKLRETWGGEEG